MIRTFLVALELGDDSTDLQILAADVQDSLMQDGFEVSSVKPWDSPSPEVTSAFSTQFDPQDNSQKRWLRILKTIPRQTRL